MKNKKKPKRFLAVLALRSFKKLLEGNLEGLSSDLQGYRSSLMT